MGRVFGLTGGIGSGKSTVAGVFRELGVPVVFADQLAREAVAQGAPALARIAQEFGPDVFGPGGELDRQRLGAVVFADEAKRRTLNSIVHPEVGRLAAARFAELAEAGHELCCYEVPLLFESGLEAMLRPVVLVAASEQAQIERLRTRDGLDEAAARARIGAQLPLAEKRARADIVIDNDGSLPELEARARDALVQVRAFLAGSAPA